MCYVKGGQVRTLCCTKGGQVRILPNVEGGQARILCCMRGGKARAPGPVGMRVVPVFPVHSVLCCSFSRAPCVACGSQCTLLCASRSPMESGSLWVAALGFLWWEPGGGHEQVLPREQRPHPPVASTWVATHPTRSWV